jgi:hypothetical protein
VLENPAADLVAPKWPDGGIQKLFALAFRNRVISTVDHPMLKALRGEGI